MGQHVARRLVGDRYRRVWALVQEIADRPGQSRGELAARFHLSERQLQADLNIVRGEIGLPLVRSRGYRFADDGGMAATGSGAFDLREAQLLVLVLQQAVRDRAMPRERLVSMLERLPSLFPVHLRPVMQRTVAALLAPPSAGQQVFLAVSAAIMRDRAARLHMAPGSCVGGETEPVLQPSLLLPHMASWFVLGECERGRTRMVALEDVRAVTVAEGVRP